MSDSRNLGGIPRPYGMIGTLYRMEELWSTPWGPFDEVDKHMASARKDFFAAFQREIVDPLLREAGKTPTEYALKLAFAGLVELFHHQQFEIKDQLARRKFDQSGCKLLLTIVDRMVRLEAACSAESRGGRGRGPRRRRR